MKKRQELIKRVQEYLRELGIRVISVVSQKGGVGKSTIARALARQAASEGIKTFLIDLDIQQGTSYNWYLMRKDVGYGGFCQTGLFETFADGLEAMETGTRVIIVDGPARASMQTEFLARISNVIVQPTGTTFDEIDPAILLFHELAKKGIPIDRLLFVLTRVSTKAEFKEAFKYISSTGYEVAKEFIPEKTAYKKAQNKGLTIIETQYANLNSKAGNVVERITETIKEILE
ncbi:MAG: ParA family protein [bacterium]|nr:ParA family protein [bacterium]